MAAHSFEDLIGHIGHNIVCVTYGDPAVNVALECEGCGMVLLDFDRGPKRPLLPIRVRAEMQNWHGHTATNIGYGHTPDDAAHAAVQMYAAYTDDPTWVLVDYRVEEA
jgi:hypothetical protein